MPAPTIARIVSGGQTGVDRAALDVAIFLEIPHGGWCPRGRRAEDGPISKVYQLTETGSANYVVRTEKNVIDSQGTLILFRDSMTRGTALTASFARRHNRPCLAIDIAEMQSADHDDGDAAAWMAGQVGNIHTWMVKFGIELLNVAGPRESTTEGISADAHALLMKTFAEINVV